MAFEVDIPSLAVDADAIQRDADLAKDRLMSHTKLLQDLAFLKGLPGLTPTQALAFEDAHRNALDVLTGLSKAYVRTSKELIALQSL